MSNPASILKSYLEKYDVKISSPMIRSEEHYNLSTTPNAKQLYVILNDYVDELSSMNRIARSIAENFSEIQFYTLWHPNKRCDCYCKTYNDGDVSVRYMRLISFIPFLDQNSVETRRMDVLFCATKNRNKESIGISH